MKYYTEDHEWVEIIGESAIIGVSQYAVEAYGDVTFAELPEEGDDFIIGDRIGSIETDEYTVELCAPICGSVAKINEALVDEPELISESPEEKGWICKIDNIDDSELDDMMDETFYRKYLRSLK